MAKKAQKGGRGHAWRIAAWGGAACLLLLPLIAMPFTGEVNWTAFDFLFMAALMGSAGLGLEMAFAKRRDAAYRTAVGVALAAALLLVWITGAAGIIGNEEEDANALYGGVIAAGLLGGIGALFRPAGMAWAMAAAALVQVGVPLIAMAFIPDTASAVPSPEVLALTVCFTGMWLLSAALFYKAARKQPGAA